MAHPKPTTIDFETFGSEGRPSYPPSPVGVSVKKWGRKPRYYAFGHPTKNNCKKGDAIEAVKQAYQCPDGVLFQNGKFDIDVAEEWFNIPVPKWDQIHDTMFLLFLDDPHQRELGLKPSSERLLGLPPDEQDAVSDWLLQHQPIPNVKISTSKKSGHYFGRYIAYAPGDLVGEYCNGDVNRTEALFKLLYQKTVDRGMLKAYNRERELMPILLEMERQGLQVDLARLHNDVLTYDRWRDYLDNWLIHKLGCNADINFNSGQQLFKAMMAAGMVDESKAPLTKTGKYQTNKEALLLAVNNRQLLAVLKYRTQLNTCLNTFMMPWLRTAQQSNGLIFTSWNQVRSPKGDTHTGARTGRLSSTPNFQNIPNTFGAIFKHHEMDRLKRLELPRSPFKELPPLPNVRSYIIPFHGDVFIDRDYSQQEPRILAHFVGGTLMEMYQKSPWMDLHDYAKAELEKAGKYYDRKPVKNTNLGLIYGMGSGTLASRNDMTVIEAKILKKAVLLLYPGLSDMQKDMTTRAKTHQPIKTWGEREYYCEEPKIINGRIKHFDYKMVNVLIQGSAADCTKEAIIRFHRVKKPSWKIVLNVHDQITSSVPRRQVKKSMEVLRTAMESVEFDVRILTEGAISGTNWAELKPYDVKGVLI